MKVCYSCKNSKDLSEFWIHSRNNDGLQNKCKDCKRIYDNNYHKNRTKIQKDTKYNKQRLRIKKFMSDINSLKLSKWCKDCGYNENPAALQFDHMWWKIYNVSELVWRWYSETLIYQEIAKCEIRCANCHFIKTSIDFNWYN